MKKLLVLIAVFAFVIPATTADAEGQGADDILAVEVLYPGDQESYSGNLYGSWMLDQDFWIFIVVGDGHLSVTVEDCCTLGDTIGGILFRTFHGIVDWGYASSPETVTLQSSSSSLSLFVVEVFYLQTLMGYPAGYFLDVSFD